jgi:peptide/nickel transport system substrate-binding protein
LLPNLRYLYRLREFLARQADGPAVQPSPKRGLAAAQASSLPRWRASKKFSNLLAVTLNGLLFITACLPSTTKTIPPEVALPTQIVLNTKTAQSELPVSPPTTEPPPPKVLVICSLQEPDSLFLYGGASIAKQNILEAIYDGPFDYRDYEYRPVILEGKPSPANGGAWFETARVNQGDLIVDNMGNLANLDEGVLFRPSGCMSQECAKKYTGNEPVMMDALIVRFKLLSGITWSDGSALTADDSVFSYELAKNLSPASQPYLINFTQSYQATDKSTVEWRGLPGYQDPLYYSNFFSPFPRHVWENVSLEETLKQAPDQTPIGWGPYVIDSWIRGDHISLQRNPNYFRSAEGLPRFDALVYRFVEDGEQIIDALLSGECDIVDQSARLEQRLPRLLELQKAEKLSIILQVGAGWEQVAFGMESLNPERTRFFDLKEVRQAVALCIDRTRIVDELFSNQSLVLDSYILPSDPFHNPEIKHYDFDPQAGSELLTSVGWLDQDNDPNTPRTAQGVPGVADGTPFEVTYLTTTDEERGRASHIVQESLAECGIRANVDLRDWEELLAPGPEGSIFGRDFDLAQFGWSPSLLPPCFLFMSDEIPGPYPDFPQSWSGVNITGYSNPDFDRSGTLAWSTLPDSSEYKRAQYEAQAIFAEDLPSIPLYAHLDVLATRPDMCGIVTDASSRNALWHLESFDYGENCVTTP